jgi:hypothetical protein
MALSKETASQIVQAVFSDAKCRRVITLMDGETNVGAMKLLSITHQAGWVKDGWLLLKGLDKEEHDQLNCIGVALATVEAINKKKSSIPDLAAVSTIHRSPGGWHAEATWIRMSDDSQYVFDWHSTLDCLNPLISTKAEWLEAKNAIDFVLFKGLP